MNYTIKIIRRALIVVALVSSTYTIFSQGKTIKLEDISKKSGIPIELYVLSNSKMEFKDMSFFDVTKAGQSGKMVSVVYLVKHPKGIILFDTGDADSIANYKEGITSSIGHTTMDRKLIDQLDELKLKPKDINYLAMSHLHSDHVGNVFYFGKSTLVIQKAEFDAIEATKQMMLSYGATNVDAYDYYKSFKTQKLIEGHYDMFGDGSVVFISTPGHSTGHQSLYLNLPEYGPVILAADLYLTKNMRENYIMPSYVASKRQLIKSFSIVDDLISATGAELWLMHDTEQYETLRKSPEFYK